MLTIFIISVSLLLLSILLIVNITLLKQTFALNANESISNITKGKNALPAKAVEVKPTLTIHIFCQMASQIIPVNFNASGFHSNNHVGITITNGTISSSSQLKQFSGIHNDFTDSSGQIKGEFNIDVRKGNFEGYSLNIFTDNDRDDMPDKPNEVASSLLKCG
jgi:hypothetical protein